MSEFINRSKHRFSSAVESHIMGGSKPDLTKEGPFVSASPGALPKPKVDVPFSQGDAGHGVNYAPQADAGHGPSDLKPFGK